MKKGLVEAEFIAKIHAEFSMPNTCVAGYNSIRFDDEVSRYSFYRNFYDPYEREYKNNNRKRATRLTDPLTSQITTIFGLSTRVAFQRVSNNAPSNAALAAIVLRTSSTPRLRVNRR